MKYEVQVIVEDETSKKYPSKLYVQRYCSNEGRWRFGHKDTHQSPRREVPDPLGERLGALRGVQLEGETVGRRALEVEHVAAAGVPDRAGRGQTLVAERVGRVRDTTQYS